MRRCRCRCRCRCGLNATSNDVALPTRDISTAVTTSSSLSSSRGSRAKIDADYEIYSNFTHTYRRSHALRVCVFSCICVWFLALRALSLCPTLYSWPKACERPRGVRRWIAASSLRSSMSKERAGFWASGSGCCAPKRRKNALNVAYMYYGLASLAKATCQSHSNALSLSLWPHPSRCPTGRAQL